MRILKLLLIIITTNNTVAQEYTPPFSFDLLLSGTFGELRNNHFHAGIDLKTKGVQGQEVRSIADGYISRIKVSTWGYGKAIYIEHPKTGHTSVYAHLKAFNEEIENFVRKEHYRKESFELDLYLEENQIKVKQGEIIAISGNTGGSSGPHLHFEIRDSKNQHPINPLKFGFEIVDNIPPIIKKLKIYSFDTTLINGYNSSQIYNTQKINQNYYSIKDNITINGNFGIGVFTYDQSDNSHNKNGIYSIKLSVDNSPYYQFKVDELDFQTNRYINAHIDYAEKIKNSIKYHRCYKLPNNKLTNYKNVKNNGIISFNDTLKHNIKIEISDIYGNKSKLEFQVKSTKQPFLKKCPTINKNTTAFTVSSPNIFKEKGVSIHMESFSLYEPIMFNYESTDSIQGVLGKVHHIHYNSTPVHKQYVISLKEEVPEEIKLKTYIATTDMKGKFSYIGGVWIDGYIKTKAKEFGNFCIVADTTPPIINPINIHDNKKIDKQNKLRFKIRDQQSGIKSYRGEINGKWILMEYEHKKDELILNIENVKPKGNQKLRIEVIDNVGNISNCDINFNY